MALSCTAAVAPVEKLLQDAMARGEVTHSDMGLAAGGLIGMLESLHGVPGHELSGNDGALIQMAYILIDVFLDWLRRA